MARRDTIFGEAHLGPLARAGNVPFVLVILLYRVTLSPFLGRQCRFEPTCSRFGLDAYRRFGPLRGTLMTTGRICRCNPFNKGGYDPVPFPHPHPVPVPIPPYPSDQPKHPVHCETGEPDGEPDGGQAGGAGGAGGSIRG
ncbi:MAG: membrane protein insertion efficiency factor YidD [Planctomycetota bacterium]|nr:membrane protein insertion efficiency factor YidD [Planctomycetota bacterium]